MKSSLILIYLCCSVLQIGSIQRKSQPLNGNGIENSQIRTTQSNLNGLSQQEPIEQSSSLPETNSRLLAQERPISFQQPPQQTSPTMQTQLPPEMIPKQSVTQPHGQTQIEPQKEKSTVQLKHDFQTNLEIYGRKPEPTFISRPEIELSLLPKKEHFINLDHCNKNDVILQLKSQKKVITNSFFYTVPLKVTCFNCDEAFKNLAQKFSRIKMTDNDVMKGIALHCHQNIKNECSLYFFDKHKECHIDSEESMMIVLEILTEANVNGEIWFYTRISPCMRCLWLENKYIEKYPVIIHHYFIEISDKDLTYNMNSKCFSEQTLYKTTTTTKTKTTTNEKEGFYNQYYGYITGELKLDPKLKLTQLSVLNKEKY